MKALAALAILLLPAPAVPQATAPLAPNSTYYSTDAPPMRYRGDTAAAVFFLSDVSAMCGTAGRPGYVIMACASDTTIAMPDPCPLADRESFARIMCHEIGHVRGWPATHGD